MTKRVLPVIRSYCVVLERVAWGAGETRWYVAHEAQELESILSMAASGSAISCYFDDRIRQSTWSTSTRLEVLEVLKGSGDCVVAKHHAGSNLLDVAFIAGESDFDEFFPTIKEGEVVFIGAFPERDDDGVSAVSWIVPNSSSSRLHDLEVDYFPPIDLGGDVTALGRYVVRSVSVFDHWLDENEAAESGIMSYGLSLESGQIDAYLVGEMKFLNFYKALACEGVVVDRPGRRRILQPHDPEFEELVLASLRESRFMDAYFPRYKVRIIGRYDRTDLALLEREASVDELIRLTAVEGLHLL